MQRIFDCLSRFESRFDGFHRVVKSVLRNFLEMGFKRVVVIIMHQGMGGPLAQSFSKAASELAGERVLERYPRGWWADPALRDRWADFGSVQVESMIPPEASPPAVRESDGAPDSLRIVESLAPGVGGAGGLRPCAGR